MKSQRQRNTRAFDPSVKLALMAWSMAKSSIGNYKSKALLTAFLFAALILGEPSLAQGIQDAPPATAAPPPQTLDLAPDKVSHLKDLVAAHAYIDAEKVLLEEIGRDPHAARAAPLLAYLGSVDFLNHDYLNAAIAWKKSEKIQPLDPSVQFSLAMAYIQIQHPAWARTVLESLAAHDATNALYPYWLGRLDYDAQQYPGAIHHLQQAIALDHTLSRAYDNLGLVYFQQNQNGPAVENFTRAITLDRIAQHPSAWPYINRGIALQFLGRTHEAEADLRDALKFDPGIASAHYHLGNLLQARGDLDAAAREQSQAIHLDGKYAEPHAALAHIYNQMGKKTAADEEVKLYQSLRASKNDHQ